MPDRLPDLLKERDRFAERMRKASGRAGPSRIIGTSTIHGSCWPLRRPAPGRDACQGGGHRAERRGDSPRHRPHSRRRVEAGKRKGDQEGRKVGAT